MNIKKTITQLIQPFWKKIPLIPPARFSRFQLMRYISQTQGDTDSMATTVPNLDCWRWENPKISGGTGPSFSRRVGGGKGQLLIWGGGRCNRIKPSEMKKLVQQNVKSTGHGFFSKNGKWKTSNGFFNVLKNTSLRNRQLRGFLKFYSSAGLAAAS